MPDPTTLVDGTPVRVRSLGPEDHDEFVAAFQGLSASSRYTRFLSPMERLTDAEVRYFLAVDHHDHEALVVTAQETGERLGIGRYVRLEDRPEAAEVAFTVADAWQGRGVGSFLLDALAERARENGITVFTAEMLASNHAMRALFEHLGEVAWSSAGDAVLLAEAPLGPPAG